MQVIVNKHTVTIIKNEIVNEGEYNVQSCNFQFSSDYDGLPKIAIFKTNTATKQIMLSGDTCITPEEVLQTTGIVGLGVYAYQTDGDNLTLRYSPTPAVFTVEPGSYDEGDAPTPPTPSVIEQLQEQITQNANNITSLENITNTHTSQIETIQGDITNINLGQATQNTNIQKNADDISDIKTEQTTQNNKIAQNTSDIATLNNNLTNYSLITETGSQIVLNVNPSNYQMTAILKDKNGNTIYTSNVIDLPIESMIVNVTYDSTTKEIVFTLQNGTTLRVSVADLVSGLVSTDELNTILASYYTKTEIDNLLSGKVDTTTYTQGQATQDANIEENASNIDWLQTLVNQMPTVSGQGTDLSLENVLNYRLIKFLPQGVSSQESTTGKNLLPITNQDFTINNVRFQAINGALKVSGTASADITGFIMRDNENFPITLEAGTYYLSRNLTNTSIGLLKQTGNTALVTLASTSSAKSASFTLTETTQLYFFFYIPNGTTKDDTFEIMVSTNDGDWEPYTGGISAPNPSYPFPVKTVTGENSLVISNSDNTETQTYPISLGNIELNSTPDGTIRDGIIGTPDNWKKKQFMQKIILNGSESYGKNASGTGFISFTLSNYITSIDKDVSNNLFSNMLQSIASGNVANTCRIASSGRIVLTFSDTFCDYDLTALSTTLQTMYNNNNPVILYIPLATATDINITDTTLIGQLNNIYNNAHSYNGVTNITTTYASGNEQMYLDVEALAKGGSSVAETDPIFSASASSGITSSDITNWNSKASTTYVDTAISNAITNTLGGSY